jgi:hypothetical protein
MAETIIINYVEIVEGMDQEAVVVATDVETAVKSFRETDWASGVTLGWYNTAKNLQRVIPWSQGATTRFARERWSFLETARHYQ